MIKRNTKFKNGIYHHESYDVRFLRIWAGIAWPGDEPGEVVVVGEMISFGNPQRYLLAEASCNTMGELINAAATLTGEMCIKSWWARHTEESKSYIRIRNKEAFRTGTVRLSISEAPGTGDKLAGHLNLILDSVRPKEKNLHFFSDSSLPAKLQGLPPQLYRLTCIEHPAVAALGYVVSAMVHHRHERINPADLIPEPLPDY